MFSYCSCLKCVASPLSIQRTLAQASRPWFPAESISFLCWKLLQLCRKKLAWTHPLDRLHWEGFGLKTGEPWGAAMGEHSERWIATGPWREKTCSLPSPQRSFIGKGNCHVEKGGLRSHTLQFQRTKWVSDLYRFFGVGRQPPHHMTCAGQEPHSRKALDKSKVEPLSLVWGQGTGLAHGCKGDGVNWTLWRA